MRHRLASCFAGLALVLAAPAVGFAGDGGGKLEKGMDPERDEGDDAPLEGDQVRDEHEYGGVRPGQGLRNEAGKELRRPRAGTLAWVGFGASGGTARIFLQATSEMAFSQRLEGATLVVHVEGLKHLRRQVQRALETRYFDSPVARITVKKVRAKKGRKGAPGRKAGIELRITFKQKGDVREAAARTATEADGYQYLYLELAGSSTASGQ